MNDATLSKKEMFIGDDGLLRPKSIDDLWRLANIYFSSNWLPKQYDKIEKVFIGIQFACELRLMPLVALRQIAVINGTPSVYGDLPLAIVQASGKLEYIVEYFVDANLKKIASENNNLKEEAYGHITKVKRQGDKEIYESFFTIDDAKKAALWGKPGPWTQYPKRMLKYRSRSQALKDKFADCLNGIAIAEYDLDQSTEKYPDAIQISPDKKTEKLNNIFSNSNTTEPKKEDL